MDSLLHRPLICVAPNGARLNKQDHPALPIAPQELAQCAEDCMLAGAGMIHLHVRGDQDEHVLDAGRYKAATEAIRAKLGDQMIIQITTEAVGKYSPGEQMDVVRATRPEAVSLGLRELVPDDGAVEEFQKFWDWLESQKTLAQIILYDRQDVRRLLEYRRKGIFGRGTLSVLFVLGRYGNQISRPENLLEFLRETENEDPLIWSVCAFGPHENACVVSAAAMGGHIRIGYENNRLLPDGTRSSSNAQLISNCVATLKSLGMSPLSAPQARSLLKA